MKGEEESSSEEEVTKESLLDDAESLLKEIDADKKKEHHGVFECEREGDVRSRHAESAELLLHRNERGV